MPYPILMREEKNANDRCQRDYREYKRDVHGANHYLSKDMDVAMKKGGRDRRIPLGEADTSSASGKSSDSGRR